MEQYQFLLAYYQTLFRDSLTTFKKLSKACTDIFIELPELHILTNEDSADEKDTKLKRFASNLLRAPAFLAIFQFTTSASKATENQLKLQFLQSQKIN